MVRPDPRKPRVYENLDTPSEQVQPSQRVLLPESDPPGPPARWLPDPMALQEDPGLRASLHSLEFRVKTSF